MTSKGQIQQRVVSGLREPSIKSEAAANSDSAFIYGPASRFMVYFGRAVYAISAVVVGMLVVRFTISLLGVNHTYGFGHAVYSVTHPLVMPFFGLFNYKLQYGTPRFEVETLLAAAVYAVIAALIITILAIPRTRDNL